MGKKIDPMDVPAKCGRCGYVYKPGGKAVIVFQAEDGIYAGCEDCFADIGRAKESDRHRVIKEMKVRG